MTGGSGAHDRGVRCPLHGGQGESLVPPHTRESVSLSGAHYKGVRCPLQGGQVPVIGGSGAHYRGPDLLNWVRTSATVTNARAFLHFYLNFGSDNHNRRALNYKVDPERTRQSPTRGHCGTFIETLIPKIISGVLIFDVKHLGARR
jgi:hypothetical protein